LAPIEDYKRRAHVARWIASVLGLGLGLFVALPLLFEVLGQATCQSSSLRCSGDDSYAVDFFAGLTPIAAPIASRRFGDSTVSADLQGFNCTFAIAALDSHAPKIPPTMRRSDRADMVWGGGWRSATALSPKEGEDLRSLLAVCSPYWTRDVQEVLLRSISDRRALISGRAPYREINLYLPPSDAPGLAARIRFGD
jgi:hypothetical protein